MYPAATVDEVAGVAVAPRAGGGRNRPRRAWLPDGWAIDVEPGYWE